MPTLEVLAEVMEESGKGISIATVDCTVFKQLCTNRFNIRVNHSAEICYSAFSCVVLAQEVTDRHVARMRLIICRWRSERIKYLALLGPSVSLPFIFF